MTRAGQKQIMREPDKDGAYNCQHLWDIDSTLHDSYHLIYCRRCGVQMSRFMLITYLNLAQAVMETEMQSIEEVET